MTKADLIESVAAKLDLPKGQAERAVNLVFEDIVKALCNGDKINISGVGQSAAPAPPSRDKPNISVVGTFAVSERKARTGRKPKTGESIEIPASKSAKFKA